MIDPRTLEREFHPQGGDMGRNFNLQYDPNTGQYRRGTSTEGISPGQVDLRGYDRFIVGGQDVFVVQGSSGGMSATEWRAWWREEGGRYFCIVFENSPTCFTKASFTKAKP